LGARPPPPTRRPSRAYRSKFAPSHAPPGSILTITASVTPGTNPDSTGLAKSGPLTYAWDLDNDGIYESSGATQTFSAAALDGPSSYTAGVQVTDDGELTATATATLTVRNVAPTATFDAPAATFAGVPFTLSLVSPHDPSATDTGAGFSYAFDCAKLAQADAAPTASARAGLLGAFRNQVPAKVGKGLTAEQAAELKLLSTLL
jgi:hypothetical protein